MQLRQFLQSEVYLMKKETKMIYLVCQTKWPGKFFQNEQVGIHEQRQPYQHPVLPLLNPVEMGMEKSTGMEIRSENLFQLLRNYTVATLNWSCSLQLRGMLILNRKA